MLQSGKNIPWIELAKGKGFLQKKSYQARVLSRIWLQGRGPMALQHLMQPLSYETTKPITEILLKQSLQQD